eukprot:GAHX01005089.1.p1 GENE.GAHX01005089.1~~GAHX01005089.1.p1  ORF type:complete len:51 (-),score=0.11 GAHX01005089.1:715-867(-)
MRDTNRLTSITKVKCSKALLNSYLKLFIKHVWAYSFYTIYRLCPLYHELI